MTDLTALLQESKLNNLHCTVQNGRQRYLCYSKLTDSKTWAVSVTDGVDVWSQDLDEDGLEALRDLHNVATMESFLLRFKNGFCSSSASVGRIGNKVTLSVGKGTAVIELDLYEAKAADKKSELQSILFTLADKCEQLGTEVAAANQQIDALKAQKNTAVGLSALADLSPKKGQGPAKAKTTKVGMSVVNPSSRKRKAATGVVFD